MWAYGFMLGWKSRDHIDFDFHDAHDLNTISDRASEDTVKRKLRGRFTNAKQVVVIVGKKTKNLYRFVRWEIDVALELKLPIIVANLSEKRRMDDDLLPADFEGHRRDPRCFQDEDSSTPWTISSTATRQFTLDTRIIGITRRHLSRVGALACRG